MSPHPNSVGAGLGGSRHIGHLSIYKPLSSKDKWLSPDGRQVARRIFEGISEGV